MSVVLPSSVRGVVFDLDGTLVDSRLDLAEAVNGVREELGLDPLPVAAVTAAVGEGARRLVERALPELGRSGGDLDRALERFLDRYAAVCTRRTELYPGMGEAVERLGSQVPLAVLTNKPEAMTRRILEATGIAASFAAIVGGDTVGRPKPAPEGLERLAAKLDRAPGELCVVGDSPIDFEVARAVGSRVALVTWGYSPRETLASLPADVLAADAAGLVRAVEALLAA